MVHSLVLQRCLYYHAPTADSQHWSKSQPMLKTVVLRCKLEFCARSTSSHACPQQYLTALWFSVSDGITCQSGFVRDSRQIPLLEEQISVNPIVNTEPEEPVPHLPLLYSQQPAYGTCSINSFAEQKARCTKITQLGWSQNLDTSFLLDGQASYNTPGSLSR